MNQNAPCPACGKPVPADAPMGVCPNCLIGAGFGTAASDVAAEKRLAFEPPSPDELAARFPQLEILELLGCGGMGAVYKARQTELDRTVALKILPPAIGEEAGFAERFAREAKALAKLNHPGIVTIYDFGRADGLYYFLMEFVDGVNLRQLLQGERIAPREALAIVPQICDALQFAHDHGIVHRDIKPDNILLDRRGRVKVADFGIAKLTGAIEQTGTATGTVSSPFTEAGKVIGSPGYMAPEQSSDPTNVDHRADIYALGVVFYQMLTGELPSKQLEAPSKRVQIDVRLDEVVLRALAKKPELRYQQASALRTELETIVQSGSGGAPVAEASAVSTQEPPSDPEASPRFPRTAIVGACFLAFTVLALLGVIALQAYSASLAMDSAGLAPSERSGLHGRWELIKTLVIGLQVSGLISALVGTALGWVAVAQIRNSGGRLRGLALAFTEGIILPGLTIIGLLGWFWWWLLLLIPLAWVIWKKVRGDQNLAEKHQFMPADSGIQRPFVWGMALLSLVVAIVFVTSKREGITKEPPRITKEPSKVVDHPVVTVKYYGSDHLSYRGDALKFSDACRTALKGLSQKEVLDDRTTRYPYYSEGGTSYTSEKRSVAQRSFKKTKDESGADYQVTTIFLEGQDPVVMLEHTSKDRYRLINALLAEFHRLGFKVEQAGK